MAQPNLQRTNEGSPQIELAHGRRLAVMGAVLLGLFLSALDQTVVGTALPRIVTDLGGNGLYTWVVTIYLLTSTITVPIYGKLSDIYGRKVLMIVGIFLFLAGSFLSGLSQNMTQLIVFRGLQGMGAGALFPISLAVIGDLFTPRERGRYQGLFGAVFGLSFLIGPFIGGWLTDNINWRWVFYVNMPVGVVAVIVIAMVLPNFHPATAVRLRDLDYLGIVLFTGGVVPLLIGLTNKGLTGSNGQLHAWTDPEVGGLILLSAVLLGAFLFVESRAKQPIIPLGLFRSRTYSASMVAVFMMSFGMFAAIIFLPRYYQGVRGISATESGYMVWPLLVGLIGSSIFTGFVISRVGRYKFVLVTASALFVLGSFLMTHIVATTTNPALWLWMFVMGIGIGPSMSGFVVVIQNTVERAQIGVATSTLTFLRQIGGSVGLAISGTLFSQRFSQKLPEQLTAAGVPKHLVARFAAGGTAGQSKLAGVDLVTQLRHTLPAQLQPAVPRIVTGIHDAFSLAIGNVFWLTVASGALAFLSILVLPDLHLRDRGSFAGESASTVTGDEIPVGGESQGRAAAG